MKINPEVVETLTSLSLLRETRKTTIPIIELGKLSLAEKNINSLKWENFVLDAQGDLTVYLHKSEKELNRHWNELIMDAKQSIIPIIMEQLYRLVDEKKLVESMIYQIRFDILNLAVYLTMKNLRTNIESRIFDEILALYQSGYIPCGYVRGKYKVL